MGNEQSEWTRTVLHALKMRKNNVGKKGPVFLFLTTGQGCPVDDRIVRECLKAADIPFSAPFDWCGLRNFQEAARPRIIALPAGKGNAFRRDMERFIDEANRRVRSALLSEGVQRDIREMMRRSGRYEQSLALAFCRIMKRHGLTTPMNSRRSGPSGEPPGRGGFPASLNRGADPIRTGDADDHLGQELDTIRQRIREAKHGCSEGIRRRTERAAQRAMAPLMARLRKKYRNSPRVLVYLEDVQHDILNNLTSFTLPSCVSGPGGLCRERLHAPYTVTVLAGRTGRADYPVIFARDPDREELMGCFSPDSGSGSRQEEAPGMRGGLIHRANGGCLVLEASWIIRNIHLWELIKKAVIEHEHVLAAPTLRAGIFTSGNRISESISLQVAVVVAGTRTEHAILSIVDQEFIALAGDPWNPEQDSGNGPAGSSPDTAVVQGSSLSCHPSARNAILRFCTQSGVPDERFPRHLETLLRVIGRARAYAGIQEITAEHFSLALHEVCGGRYPYQRREHLAAPPSPVGRIRYRVEPVTMMEPTKSHS